VSDQTTRFNIQLDPERAAKLHALAERTHVPPGTLARSLLATALDGVDPDPASLVDLLDAIPGARERAERGRAEYRAGKGIPLEEW
jgi:predicted transcriptional regulator